MSDFEIGELLKIPELKVSDASNPLPDCFVKRNDSIVDAGVSDGEEVNDVLSIAGEFFETMGEGENCRSNCSVPGNVPVSSVLNQF